MRNWAKGVKVEKVVREVRIQTILARQASLREKVEATSQSNHLLKKSSQIT